MLQVKSALGSQSHNLFLHRRLGRRSWCYDTNLLLVDVLRGSMAVGSGEPDRGRVAWSGVGLSKLMPFAWILSELSKGLLLPVP